MPEVMPVTDDVARYREIERLGVGGMATVTLAEDTMLRRRVALKRVHTEDDANAILRLRREALVGASLSHPNLVSVYDVEMRADGDLVIVMEYVAGQTLRDAITGSGGLPQGLALEVLTGVASALDAIHARGIVHRDVKPANILLGREGAIKLADLGIALASDRTQITRDGMVLGTFSYMAPEQLEGTGSTPAVDIYALAVVAFEMLSGQKAHPQTNPVALAHAIATQPPPDLRAVVPDVPRAAAEVLRRGMDPDPAKRPRSATDLVDRLRVALDPEAGTIPATRPVALASPAGPIPSPAPAPAPALSPVPAPAPAPAAAASRAPAGEPPADTVGRARKPPVAPARKVAVEPVGRSGDRRGTPAFGAGLAGRVPGRQGLILAGLGVCAAVIVLIALNSGGGTPAKRTSGAAARAPSTKHGTSSASGAPRTTTAASAAGSTSTGGSQVSANPTTSTPSGAVQTFYGHAASHDYAAAWALADPAFRSQLQGYASFASGQSRVRQITFHQAQTIAQTAQSATVAVRTTSVLVDKTQQCQGTVSLVRSTAGAWMLHQISINCV
ncbi:MAG: eukaryotic-like serine/threonine-protein kinase [Solirubrobacteraceae bacterium]|jgi:hypothetical protein|nr:eukaryotic-like serine/threonine-protein kinase [Solirubrobacteraceae bacterium]